MKLLKTDNTYKYYELSERNQDESMYYDSDVVAIEKDDLKYKSAHDCLMDGDVIACNYDCKKNNNCVLDRWDVIPESIRIIEE